MVLFYLNKILKNILINILKFYSVIFIIILFNFFNLNHIIQAQNIFGEFSLNCQRIHPSYCCTSRIKNNCFELCKQHRCLIYTESQRNFFNFNLFLHI